ncbi:LysE family translocator [Paracoccus sp. M683]|uniref:LysE family translocator n=1 Tax=Paracoccus sp. M683 TaxID=2594268 RepID=UPI00117FC43D|nr:LysE family translocator [Paracoccus sp. M683]TRW99665.1 LysE family translocator [Paracoccus sp. M683]
MDLTQILTFAGVAALLVMSPGPNGLLIARTVPTSGRAAGFANIAGFIAAFLVHGTLSILGISAVLMASATAFAVIKLLGAAYLIWIGIKALRSAWRGQPASVRVQPARRTRSLHRAFTEGFLTNALNPKVSMFYLAAFPQFIAASHAGPAAAYLLVAVHSLINAVWFGWMVLMFARLTRLARDGRFQRWLQGVTGIVFVGFGLKLASLRQG